MPNLIRLIEWLYAGYVKNPNRLCGISIAEVNKIHSKCSVLPWSYTNYAQLGNDLSSSKVDIVVLVYDINALKENSLRTTSTFSSLDFEKSLQQVRTYK